MLDELLGRAELKDRIEELEEEKQHLRRRADAEEERRAEAAAKRQEAEERVNRLEDRITELEDRVERAGGDEVDLDFRGVERLSGARLDEVLSRLDAVETTEEGALTAMVADDAVPDPVRETLGDHAALVRRASPCLVVTDDAGLVSAALAPPVEPDPFTEWSDGFELDEAWLRPTGEFGFAVVRSDLFTYGAYDGRDLVDSEGFTSEVKEQHSKGGFSQQRFERLRDEQIDEHLDKCAERLDARDPDRLFVVGERTVLGRFRDRAAVTATVDATGDPETALKRAFRDFWTTQLYRI
jgi:peptide subunit release factor 1 (eRF1)